MPLKFGDVATSNMGGLVPAVREGAIEYYIIVRLQNTGIYRICNPKALDCGARAKRGCY